jgi:hypothetical protein
MALLVFWYPETYDFCSQLPYQDHVFAAIDQQLFGCQPSLEFAQVMPQKFWSEAFNMGYYAYYYMMAAVIIFYLVCRTTHYDRATFIFLGSFFIFYLVFEFLPVAGPQYYFQALHDIYGTDPFTSLPWPLPSVGHYFSTHQAAMLPEAKGIFSQLVLHIDCPTQIGCIGTCRQCVITVGRQLIGCEVTRTEGSFRCQMIGYCGLRILCQNRTTSQ